MSRRSSPRFSATGIDEIQKEGRDNMALSRPSSFEHKP
jgi:hypothetical protein